MTIVVALALALILAVPGVVYPVFEIAAEISWGGTVQRV